MCIALAFLPFVSELIVIALNLLRANVPDQSLNPLLILLDYLEKNNIHGRQQQLQQLIDGNVIQQRLPPRFPPDVWNVHNVTLATAAERTVLLSDQVIHININE